MNPRELRHFLLKGQDAYLQHLSIDCVIFGFHDNLLKVLLVKWKDHGEWSVPGGFVKKEESINDSVKRSDMRNAKKSQVHSCQFA